MNFFNGAKLDIKRENRQKIRSFLLFQVNFLPIFVAKFPFFLHNWRSFKGLPIPRYKTQNLQISKFAQSQTLAKNLAEGIR